jgi:DNA invertase Pin-like site-specific DNA recombinase
MKKVRRKKTAIAYIRVSTVGQEEKGAGLELQLSRIEAFAREAGFEIVRCFQDVHTGVGEDSIHDRPGIKAALRLSLEKRCPILVASLDRFSRETAKLEELVIKGKIRVVSVSSGEGAQRAVLMAEAVGAQQEVERISRTTKAGLARARQAGVILGNRRNLPEAQKKGAAGTKKKAELQAAELAPVVSQIRGSGKETKHEIADEMNRLGYRTSQGQRWTQENVRRLLGRVEEIEKLRDAEIYRNNPTYGSF